MRPCGFIAVLAAVVAAIYAPVAAADVYEGAVNFAAPTQPPSLTPETPIEEQSAYLSSAAVSYDSNAGTATASYSFFEPSFWAQQLPNGYSQPFALGSCNDQTVPTLTIQTGALPSSQDQGSATLSGYDGQATAWETFDGTTYSVTFTNPAFVGQAWNCATVGNPATQITLTDVTNPPIPQTAGNAGAAFRMSATANATEPSQEGPACPEDDGGGAFQCAVEYLTGSTVRLVTGVVQWDDNGHPVVSGVYRYAWTRRWHTDTHACLRSWSLRGRASSNFPCAADQIAHGGPRVGYTNGTGTGYWPWLYAYPCHSHGGVTTCSNALGDSYRFSRYPTYHP